MEGLLEGKDHGKGFYLTQALANQEGGVLSVEELKKWGSRRRKE